MFAGAEAEPLRGMGLVLFEEGGLGSSEVWVSVLLPAGPPEICPLVLGTVLGPVGRG